MENNFEQDQIEDELNTLNECWYKYIPQNEDLKQLVPSDLDMRGEISRDDSKLQIVYGPRIVR